MTTDQLAIELDKLTAGLQQLMQQRDELQQLIHRQEGAILMLRQLIEQMQAQPASEVEQ